jgi:hypothetical protein
MAEFFSRAQRYGERAAQCRRLASLATSTDERAEYEKLANEYEDIAQAELFFSYARCSKYQSV